MAQPLFESDRTFRIWLYTVSHGTLLLRSVKSGVQATRIDVVFKPVTFVSLPTTLEGLVVRETTFEALHAAHPGARTVCGPDDKVYAVSMRGMDGWVVGGVVASHQDTGADSDASHFSLPRLVG